MDEVATSYLGGRQAELTVVLDVLKLVGFFRSRTTNEPYLVQTVAKNTISALKILGLPVKSLTKRLVCLKS